MSDNFINNKRLAKNSIFLSIRMVIVLGISLYTTRAVLEMLGVVDYGVYNVVCGFVALFSFLNTSMSNGVQRFYNYELGKNGEEGANKVYCTAVLIQFLLAVVIIVLSETIGLWYLHNKMVIPQDRFLAAQWIFQFSLLSFLFIIMQAPYTASVIAHERMDFYAFVSVLDAIFKLGIVLLLPLLKGDSLIWYGFLFLLISVLNFCLYVFYAKYTFKEIRLHRFFDRHLFRSMLGFSGWNVFGSMSGVAQEHGINLVINFFFGPVVNAARGVAAQVNGGLKAFVGNITMPVRPQVVQSYARGDIERTMHLTYSISKLSSCFFVMMAIPLSLEMDFVLHLWLGNNVPNYANSFTILVLMTTVTGNLNSAVSNVVHATGQMKHYQLWGSLVKICSVPIAYILLTYWKLPEIALVCTFLMNLFGHIVCLFVLRTLIPFSLLDYVRRVILPIAIVIGCGLSAALPFSLMMPQGAFRLLVVTTVSVLSVGLSLYFFALDISERSLIKSLLSVIKSKI